MIATEVFKYEISYPLIRDSLNKERYYGLVFEILKKSNEYTIPLR